MYDVCIFIAYFFVISFPDNFNPDSQKILVLKVFYMLHQSYD